MFSTLRILVEIPALDRLMDFLDAAQQQEINALNAQVQSLTQRLHNSNTSLDGTIAKEN